jgi:hypothetical protein
MVRRLIPVLIAAALLLSACRSELWLVVSNDTDAPIIVQVAGSAWEVAPGSHGPFEFYPGGTTFQVYADHCAKLIASATIPQSLFGPADPTWSVEADGQLHESANFGGDYAMGGLVIVPACSE